VEIAASLFGDTKLIFRKSRTLLSPEVCPICSEKKCQHIARQVVSPGPGMVFCRNQVTRIFFCSGGVERKNMHGMTFFGGGCIAVRSVGIVGVLDGPSRLEWGTARRRRRLYTLETLVQSARSRFRVGKLSKAFYSRLSLLPPNKIYVNSFVISLHVHSLSWR